MDLILVYGNFALSLLNQKLVLTAMLVHILYITSDVLIGYNVTIKTFVGVACVVSLKQDEM